MLSKKMLVLIVLLLIVSLLVACGPKNNDGDKNLTGNLQENEGDSSEIEIIDMDGRVVRIPANVEKIFSTGPVGTIILYSLNPDKLVGWNYDLREGEKRYISEKYHHLPNLGGAGKSSISIEEVLKVDPDVIINIGKIDSKLRSETEKLEDQTGKPVLILDDDINKLGEVYEILGKILNDEARAKDLADYCQATLKMAEENTNKIKEEDKVEVYYAEGPKGLLTEPSGAWHAEVLDIVGAKNVAEVDMDNNSGQSEVSMEQLLSWDPELIISWDDERGSYYSEIFKDPIWQDIKAVKNKEVYEIPNKPFNWFDRPPSVNRVLGIRWFGNLLYPKVYDYDISKEVRDFYDIFYHYKLNDEELDELLKNSIRH